jgi:hypothetical protein
MTLFHFESVSIAAGGGEETLRAVGEGRNPFGGGPAERAAQAQFARALTTRGQRAAAARRARAR